MQTSKQWTHQRRTGGAVDPVDALIEVSVSAAASGDVLNAIRLVRFAEEMAKFQRKREVARLLSIAQPPTPVKAPRAPLKRLTVADLPYVRPAYSDEEKAELKRLYRLGGIEHLMPPFED